MALGLYENQQVAKSVALKFAILNRPLYGIVIMPLECFEEEPDVVLFITNTREAMRIVQGYTCTYGLQNNFCMSGNQAVCVECTNYPYINQCINPVSYTHLDVYKRQVPWCSWWPPAPAPW